MSKHYLIPNVDLLNKKQLKALKDELHFLKAYLNIKVKTIKT